MLFKNNIKVNIKIESMDKNFKKFIPKEFSQLNNEWQTIRTCL
jgi:hypothetical protein